MKSAYKYFYKILIKNLKFIFLAVIFLPLSYALADCYDQCKKYEGPIVPYQACCADGSGCTSGSVGSVGSQCVTSPSSCSDQESCISCDDGSQACVSWHYRYWIDIEGSAFCANPYCECIKSEIGTCAEPEPCHAGGTYCGFGDTCCSPYTCIANSCQCTPCPDPSTYCPGQTAQDGCGNNCAAQGTKICDPGPPTGFGHSANTVNTITWTWTKPLYDPNSNGYWGTPTKYQLFDSLGNLIANNIPTTACSGSACSWQETSLSTNTSYARYVKACNQTVCSVPSNTASAYTSIQPVASVLCTSIGLNSIQVTAYSASGLGFSNLTLGSSGIRFQRAGFDAGYQQSNIYVFSGLSPSTAYTFTAGPSRNGDNESAAGTANVTCVTQAVLPTPNAQANLHHTGNTVNTIDWAWDASAGATYYTLESLGDDLWWHLRPGSIILTSYHQITTYSNASGWNTPLSANTYYGFGVRACNGSGCSGLSIANAATSIQPPTDIICNTITSNSMKAWAQGSFTNLTVGSSGIIFREVGGASQDSQSTLWNLLGLIPEKSYTFYVKARNQKGDLTVEFGPKICATLSPTISVSLRTYGPGGSILKLALINVWDALSLNRGTIKTRIANGSDLAAYLVDPTDPNTSPVRIKMPDGSIKAWRLAP